MSNTDRYLEYIQKALDKITIIESTENDKQIKDVEKILKQLQSIMQGSQDADRMIANYKSNIVWQAYS